MTFSLHDPASRLGGSSPAGRASAPPIALAADPWARRAPVGARRRRRAIANATLVAALAAWLGACADDTSADAKGGVGERAGLLVVSTDYASTSLSWVDPGTLAVTAPAFLHSGTRVSASGAALSGDVVPGTSGLPDGRFPVLDRSHSTLTWVGGAGDEPKQWALSDGFVANPQDAHVVGADLVAVVRAQADPTPSSHPKSGGDDVLLLDASGVVTGRVSLAAESTLPGGLAFPGRGALVGQTLWLPLASLAKDFGEVGEGRVVGVDLVKRQVVARAELPGLRNCTWVQPTSAEGSQPGAGGDPGRSEALLVGTCSGPFQASEAAQRAASGVFNVRVTAAGPVATPLVRGADWSEGGAVAFPVAQDGQRRGWFVRFGRLGDTPRADAVWDYAPTPGERPPAPVYTGAAAFQLGGLWLDRARQRLWVSDAGSPTGDLVVLDVSGEGAQVVARIQSASVGLPAVHLAPRVGL